MKNKLIFIFLDGIGLGEHVDTNPLTKASMPTMHSLVGEPLTRHTNVVESDILVKGIDACLGVDGIPQSATGQTSLFTGFNAQAFLGHHLMAYPNNQLISLINKRSILKYAREKHIKSIFANSYTDGFFKSFDKTSPNYSVTTRCVLAARTNFNTLDDLIENRAVHWDITNSTLQDIPNNRVPLVSPFKAGQNLKNITDDYDLVLFECFLPDLIGHKKDMDKSIMFLEMFDEFLKGVITDKAENVHILISSDHGNIEDLSFGGHSKNPVPLIFIGNRAPQFLDVNSIDEIFNAIFLKLFDTASIAEFEKVR
ncbi:Phosphoglyceromutase [Fulvivirga imtechensis AK7]|uniref:Phosphoglyceromutase n=1 Tax=Fulvivirga imtechensis AK7 TaxID=1237149 RepID=L8JJ75_9BACT|nr:phosphoglyceromutase [Fulvivirga imtechensis]ELR68273.1 Phosphoglyceromutase [Fulvivirga imtechensis AK7]